MLEVGEDAKSKSPSPKSMHWPETAGTALCRLFESGS